jgi:hypothetical protein
MKTNNLSGKSFLASIIMLATAMFTLRRNGAPSPTASGHTGSPFFIPRRSKFKGYMRENRRCSFNKRRRAA